MTGPRKGVRYHGDQALIPGVLDFAVNVRAAAPPRWLRDRLAARLDELGSYPRRADEERAVAVIAERHGRTTDEVLLLAGAAEGFAMLPRLKPRRAAVFAPAFTEPEAVLAHAGVPIDHVVLPPPFTLGDAAVPEDADLVVIGNPTNPTSVLHRRTDLLALRRPRRILVVDEAFMDAVPGEPESLATHRLPGLVVLRSLTKTWALAGLRAGYAVGDPEVLDRLAHGRAHWPLGTLQLEALIACNTPEAVALAGQDTQRLVDTRRQQADALRGLGLTVTEGSAPFLLVTVPDASLMRKHLEVKNIAVRRCDTFVGLGGDYLRVAVRPEWPELVQAMKEIL
ncbi:Rv2231c family pyridoxal phosphate-dependent protein CobC [Mycobacteroides salmoniphilum]|uniref:Aminotransferase n=1 Tax=Mycobacteroides salmoniphilum TaxID=404941 RepID=A0A4R8SDK4_9MYCO|nr:Rv2231c family pyridoxal phosphate-dependent protein CobC [Mycobacteroides salmoniphilum]TDZ93547.1 Threonine-phosphate decarboxylase [Mycobacteroides salmoniphilum]TEA09330.1 Threonine-phosphate decarboxylase [Mycobacteroides salmoniphilum]